MIDLRESFIDYISDSSLRAKYALLRKITFKRHQELIDKGDTNYHKQYELIRSLKVCLTYLYYELDVLEEEEEDTFLILDESFEQEFEDKTNDSYQERTHANLMYILKEMQEKLHYRYNRAPQDIPDQTQAHRELEYVHALGKVLYRLGVNQGLIKERVKM